MLFRIVTRFCAALPNNAGVRFVLKLDNTLQSLVATTVKLHSRRGGRSHPKHEIDRFHEFFFEEIGPRDRVLEVGSAYGDVANALAERAAKVTGLEIRKDAHQKAVTSFRRANLELVCGDFFAFDRPPNSFDVVVMSNVLEHVDDRIGFLSKAAELAPKLLVRVPAFDRSWLVPFKKSHNVEWRLNRDHRTEYTEADLRGEIDAAGFELNRILCKWGNYCCVATRKIQ